MDNLTRSYIIKNEKVASKERIGMARQNQEAASITERLRNGKLIGEAISPLANGQISVASSEKAKAV
jgi:hypothetical protein